MNLHWGVSHWQESFECETDNITVKNEICVTITKKQKKKKPQTQIYIIKIRTKITHDIFSKHKNLPKMERRSSSHFTVQEMA